MLESWVYNPFVYNLGVWWIFFNRSVDLRFGGSASRSFGVDSKRAFDMCLVT